MTLLRSRLKDVEGHRELMRKRRTRQAVPTVALAGYTNVGKSTLLNALTGAHVSVDDRLFETLDPTTRAFREEGRAYLVTDTVGFIRKLPHGLVEAFAATLEETLAADLLLLVADASAGEDELVEQLAQVRLVLDDIGADDMPQMVVLNKIDRLDEVTRRRLRNRFPTAVHISAATGEGSTSSSTTSQPSSPTTLCPAPFPRSGSPILLRRTSRSGLLARINREEADMNKQDITLQGWVGGEVDVRTVGETTCASFTRSGARRPATTRAARGSTAPPP